MVDDRLERIRKKLDIVSSEELSQVSFADLLRSLKIAQNVGHRVGCWKIIDALIRQIENGSPGNLLTYRKWSVQKAYIAPEREKEQKIDKADIVQVTADGSGSVVKVLTSDKKDLSFDSAHAPVRTRQESRLLEAECRASYDEPFDRFQFGYDSTEVDMSGLDVSDADWADYYEYLSGR